MNLPFPVTDGLYVFLKRPLMQRGALCLAQSGFSEAEIAKIAGRSAAQFACSSTPEAVSAREAVSSIVFAEDDAHAMNDEIYARFEERSVGVENAIHDFRIRFDRLAPYLALAVLVLFAVAVYVSFKMAVEDKKRAAAYRIPIPSILSGDFGGQKKTPSEEGAEIKSSESRCGSRGADTAR